MTEPKHADRDLRVVLEPLASDDEAPLDQLFQLYCYDWSELNPLDVDENGRYPRTPLDRYLSDDRRQSFLIRVEGRMAGFALVGGSSRLTGQAGIFDMVEFHVMRRYRRMGVGSAGAAALFSRLKGPWEVRQREGNPVATIFWRRVVSEYTHGRYEDSRWETEQWSGVVQRFSSEGEAP